MEPIIARRCKSCGAAIRARATFCPQCGVPLPKESAEAAAAEVAAAAPESPPPPAIEAEPKVEELQPAVPVESEVKTSAPVLDEARRSEDVAAPSVPKKDSPPAQTAAPVVTTASGTSAKPQPNVVVASPATEEGARLRAEKLRRASSAVLDEAAADPSLRFVLVAVVLIILSVLLLLLGRVL